MQSTAPATWGSISKTTSSAHPWPTTSTCEFSSPQEVWDDPRYDIQIAAHGYVYLEIWRGMYGLKEAAIIAFNQLVQKLAPAGFKPLPFTPGLWRHTTKPTTFVLCVDDFGVKYFSKPDAQHLIDAITAHYALTHALFRKTNGIVWQYLQQCSKPSSDPRQS
jgi:hypothetical protein